MATAGFKQYFNTDYVGQTAAPMLNLEFGGQDGFYPLLALLDSSTGDTFETWLNNAAYVQQNIVPIVLETPKIFDLFEDKNLTKKLKKIYVNLFSVHPMTIDGLDTTLTVETEEHRIGAGGLKQEEFVRVTQADSNIVYEIQEKLGKPVNRFLDFLIRYCIADKDTQTPLISTLPGIRDGFKGKILTPDYYTGKILFVELDAMNANVQEAWLVANFAPKTAGEVKGKRDLGSNKELKTYSIDCTGIVENTALTKAYAQRLIDRMSIFSKDPQTRPLAINQKRATSTLNGDESLGGFNMNETVPVPQPVSGNEARKFIDQAFQPNTK